MKKLFNVLKQWWLTFSRWLGRVNTIILLTVVYIVAVGIMAIITKLFRMDLLQKKLNPTLGSYWLARTSSEQTLERHKYQF